MRNLWIVFVRKVVQLFYGIFGGQNIWKKRKGTYVRIFLTSTGIIVFYFFAFPHIFPIHSQIECGSQNIHYLLSSISQGLATVFVLIITIPILLASLVAPSGRLKKLLRDELLPQHLIFYGFFLLTIVFPLWLLYSDNFPSWLIKIGLTSTTICLYGVIEAALAFKKRIIELFGEL